ncbi:MAG: hypothetical protein Ct9H300mP28_26160 [Pseudomonadota bacterium]|nr:MAG: hypothetical protein Ct9H300mP28_26160 [Pseudomonadota bacterium]
MINFNLVKFIEIESYSYVFLSLWIIFICYYGDVFNKLKSLPYLILALIGVQAVPGILVCL